MRYIVDVKPDSGGGIQRFWAEDGHYCYEGWWVVYHNPSLMLTATSGIVDYIEQRFGGQHHPSESNYPLLTVFARFADRPKLHRIDCGVIAEFPKNRPNSEKAYNYIGWAKNSSKVYNAEDYEVVHDLIKQSFTDMFLYTASQELR